MRPTIVCGLALVVLALAGSHQAALAALYNPSLVDVCVNRAAENVDKIALDEKLEEFGAYKFFQSKNLSEMEFYMKKCKDLTERLRFALIETECEYDLEKYVTPERVKSYPRFAKAVTMRDNCQEARAEAGLIGDILIGEFDWVEKVANLMKKDKIRQGEKLSKYY